LKIERILLLVITIAGVSIAVSSMEIASAETSYMQDITISSGLSTYSGRPIQAEYVDTSSVLVGDQIDTIIVQLKKVGLPTGNVQIGIFNTDLSVKKIFATIDASTFTTSYKDYTFSLSTTDQPYQIQAGDRIGIKFAGGDTLNYIAIMTDQNDADPFDGINTYHTYYNTSWKSFTTKDLYMTLKLVNYTPGTKRVDSFGVQQFYSQKIGKQSLVIGYDNPNTEPGVVVDGKSSAIPQTLGKFNYYTVQPRTGGLSSGGTQLTMRINLNPLLSSGTQTTWQVAEKVGYMVSPKDIDEFEQTGYFRIKDVTKDDDISFKQGGQQTSSNPSFAGAFGIDVSYSGTSGITAEKELNHAQFEFFKDVISLHTGSLVNKWIGVKEISRHVSSGQLYEVYVDLDPIDFTTGMPKNNWQHLCTHLDDGKLVGIYSGHITTWVNKYFTYRLDNSK